MVKKPEFRVFLDSNVIFSGLYSNRGAPAEILDMFIEGHVNVVISRQVLEEVVRTLSLKIPALLPTLKTLLDNVSLEIIEDPTIEEIKKWSRLIDSEDAAILAAAVNAEPDFFITGDNHFHGDAVIKRKLDLRIIKPAEFAKFIGGDETPIS